MSAAYRMTWDAAHRRWRVQHQGRRLVVSCDQLVRAGLLDPTLPHTKRGSYAAANAWLDLALAGDRRADVRGAGGLLDAWLDDQDRLADAGTISQGEARNRRYYAAAFREHLGGGPIDGPAWSAFCKALADRVGRGEVSPEYASKILRTARSFVRHLDAIGACERPRNLDDRTIRFRPPRPAIVVLPPDRVAEAVRLSRGQHRLHLLLCLNCGFTQADVSDLAHAEVDWTAGRVTRVRSKARHYPDAPVVSYRLWIDTFELLNEYRSSHPTLVLVTKSGRPWVDRGRGRSDMIRDHWRKTAAAMGLDASLKVFRKTGASLLASHPEHHRFDWLYLGHTPPTVKDRHYCRPDQNSFDRAVAWLGHFLGFRVAPELTPG